MWVFRAPAWVVECLHCAHFCGFSPEWVTKCLFKSPASPHCSQLYNLSPECHSEWPNAFFKCPARPNDLLHCAHLCNFSPVWIIMWILKWLTHSNPFLHCANLCAFSPEWVSLWLFRLPAWSNVFLHWSHLKTCSAGSNCNTGHFMKCAREIQKRKWAEIQSEKCNIANWQTGGGELTNWRRS